MRLEFSDLDYAYTFLRTWGGQDLENLDPETISIEMQYSWAELYRPFKHAALVLKRRAGNYSSELLIQAENERVFRDSSEELEKRIRNWKSTKPNGCGYVIDGDGEPAIVMTDFNNLTSRIIAMGIHGPKLRKFPDSGEFHHDLGEIQTIANILIQVCTARLITSKDIDFVPDHTVYISP